MKWLTGFIAFAGLTGAVSSHSRAAVNQTTCADTTYRYRGLEGYGRLPSNARDKYGDTIGGIGSSMAFDPASWQRTAPNSYAGVVYCLPDRGWNTNGTINFQSRIHKFHITLHLSSNASAQHPSKPNLHLQYKDTILLTDPDNKPLTSLDPDVTGSAHYEGFPPLPASTYPGDGFGGAGEGGRRVSVDPEGLALQHQDDTLSFWVSDEYGPYVYRFSAQGRMEHAIQPPAAYLPRRNGTLSFNAATPPLYDPDNMPVPEEPASGRSNNQGFEALTLSPDGRTLYTMLQSALTQEGGPDDETNQPVRLLEYDISSAEQPQLKHEYAVLLPRYTNADGDSLVAAQSEIHHLPRPHGLSSSNSSSSRDFLVLSRDSDAGHGQADSRSVYRHADIFSITEKTTDLRGKYDGATAAIASSEGELHDDITPAQYCPFIDYNVDSELAKFGLHNGGPQDEHLLNEKWESLALLPVDPDHRGGGGRREYLLFSFSDNDFMTQDGYMNFGDFKYADESGYNLDSQVLVFRVEF